MRIRRNMTDRNITEDYIIIKEQGDRTIKRWVVLGAFFFVLNLCLILGMCIRQMNVGRSDMVLAQEGIEAEKIDGQETTVKKGPVPRKDKDTNQTEQKELNHQEESEQEEQSSHQRKKVYLTFDDGPSENTEKILDILHRHKIYATFFVVGKEDESSEKIYQRIVKEGHTIGLHSYSHNYDEIYSSPKAFFQDLHKIDQLVYDKTGVHTKFYRFPGGTSNKVCKTSMKGLTEKLVKKGYLYYDWNVVSQDASGKDLTKNQMMHNVLKDVENHQTSVVLMHDGADKKDTVKMLPGLIKELKRRKVDILPIDKNTPLIQHLKTKA